MAEGATAPPAMCDTPEDGGEVALAFGFSPPAAQGLNQALPTWK